jgi:hypothetical protein
MEQEKELVNVLDKLNRRFYSEDVKSFTFKHQYKPGLIKYYTIDLGKKYRIDSSSKKISGSLVEVLSFIYNQKENPKTATPLGVRVKFLRTNSIGTYYDMHELKEEI